MMVIPHVVGVHGMILKNLVGLETREVIETI